METISTLQQQYPLSPKKFWKKMIEKLGVIYVLAAMGIIIDFIVIFMTKDSYNTSASLILWGALVVGIVIVFLITILYGWYVRVYINRYYYAGEEHFITIKKGVFAPTEIHVQWQKIQDVYVDQDILDRIMGLYDVHIASATATSGIEAHIDGVEFSAAEGLKKFFLDKMTNKSGLNNSQNSAVSQTTQDTQPLKSINLSGEISSKVYPLSTKWTLVNLLGRIVSAFAISAFILFVIFGKSKNVSFQDDLGYYILGWLALSIITVIWRTITLFLWKKNYSFSFNPDNIFFKEGVISLSEKHMPYSSIQDVTVQQGVIERVVGLAKVRIENAANQSIITKRGAVPVFTGVMIQGLSITDANKITDILKSTVLGKNTGKYGL